MPSWDELLQAADVKYAENKDKHKDQMLPLLTPMEQLAVILANLNYQIENGGIKQYIGNQYNTATRVDALEFVFRASDVPEFNAYIVFMRNELIPFLRAALEYDDESLDDVWEDGNCVEVGDLTIRGEKIDEQYYAFENRLDASQAIIDRWNENISPVRELTVAT